MILELSKRNYQLDIIADLQGHGVGMVLRWEDDDEKFVFNFAIDEACCLDLEEFRPFMNDDGLDYKIRIRSRQPTVFLDIDSFENNGALSLTMKMLGPFGNELSYVISDLGITGEIMLNVIDDIVIAWKTGTSSVTALDANLATDNS